MELIDKSIPAQVLKMGSQTINPLVYGKILKIETSPGGMDILSIAVPAGKQWKVIINVDIYESNA